MTTIYNINDLLAFKLLYRPLIVFFFFENRRTENVWKHRIVVIFNREINLSCCPMKENRVKQSTSYEDTQWR